MNSIFFAVSTVSATAAIFLLHFIIHIVRKWIDLRNLKQHGTEAQARILQAQVINDSGRYLPFVRLKVEVNADAKNSFTTDVDALFSVPDLPVLTANKVITVKYNPSDLTQIIMVKTNSIKKESYTWQPPVASPDLVMAQ